MSERCRGPVFAFPLIRGTFMPLIFIDDRRLVAFDLIETSTPDVFLLGLAERGDTVLLGNVERLTVTDRCASSMVSEGGDESKELRGEKAKSIMVRGEGSGGQREGGIEHAAASSTAQTSDLEG